MSSPDSLCRPKPPAACCISQMCRRLSFTQQIPHWLMVRLLLPTPSSVLFHGEALPFTRLSRSQIWDRVFFHSTTSPHKISHQILARLFLSQSNVSSSRVTTIPYLGHLQHHHPILSLLYSRETLIITLHKLKAKPIDGTYRPSPPVLGPPPQPQI